MKFKSFRTQLAGLVLSASCLVNVAQAGIIHTFTFDDISAWQEVTNIAQGDSLAVDFKDTTNFNDVLWSDVLSFQFNLSLGDTPFVNTNLKCNPDCDSSATIFSLVDDTVLLTFTNGDSNNGIRGVDSKFKMGGISAGTWTGLYTNLILAGSSDNTAGDMSGLDNGVSVVYSSGAPMTKVPEPSTLAIFALGLIGLASRRFKKQS